ncbi:hypothetical protein RB2150_16944 [Rhodobacterales bacterium HTCC2150]|nr:hypothetical protein RB2150_16944 [Rhodobacterales bacterium HTCC2150] [Rhodobacteraceae bacterium HTCC2150]
MSIRVLLASVALSAIASAAVAHDPNNNLPHTGHSAQTPEYINANTYTAGPSGHMYVPHYEDPGIVVISRTYIRGGNYTIYPLTNVYDDPTANGHNLGRTQIYNN